MRQHARAVAGLGVVGIGTMTAPLDTAVNIAFPAITGQFGLPLAMIQWVVIAYVLTYAALMLVFGRLGDLHGYRRVFAGGLVIGGIGFAACAMAPSFYWLLGFRVLQGVGAAMVMCCGPALASSLFSESRRSRVLGVYTMMFALGGALGPLIGGALVEAFDWRAVFWFRAPIALATLALIWVLPADVQRARPSGGFDGPGAVLQALALGLILLTASFAANAVDNPLVVAGLGVAAIAALAAFVRRQARFPAPIMGLQPFRDPDFAMLNIAALAINLAAFAVLLLVPYLLVQFLGLTPWFGGFVLALGGIGAALASIGGGWLIGRRRPRRFAFAGAVLLALGFAVIARWSPPDGLIWLAAGLLLQGVGYGLFQVAYLDIVAATLPVGERGVAGALVMVTRTVGIVLSVSLLSMAFEALRARQIAAGAAPADAFFAAFATTFDWVTITFVLFLAATLIRPRVWFR